MTGWAALTLAAAVACFAGAVASALAGDYLRSVTSAALFVLLSAHYGRETL